MLLTGIARLGRDAELRTAPSGEKVINLALAFNFGKKNTQGKRPTQWIEAALWGDRAEALKPHLLKGTALGVTVSDPHIETYIHNGEKREKLVGRLIDLEFAGGAAKPAQPAGAPAVPAPSVPPDIGARSSATDFEDDVPF